MFFKASLRQLHLVEQTCNAGLRLFLDSSNQRDPETARIVVGDAARPGEEWPGGGAEYSAKFDDWNPPSFELNEAQIAEAIARPDRRSSATPISARPTCARFAQAQLETLLPLEVETRPGVILGHKHIPVARVGSYIPGGRYPMFGSAQMSIIPAKVAGVKDVVACTPPVKGQGYYPATINAMPRRERTGSSCSAACRRSR